MDKIYKGFTDLEANCPYVAKNICNIVGQGLVNSYNVFMLGTGANIYTLRFIDDDNNPHTFKTTDKFILKWNTEMSSEEEYGSHFDFKFKAYGKIDNNYYDYLYSNDCRDNTLFNQNGHWKLKEIRFQLNDKTLKPIRDTYNCYTFCDEILKPNQETIAKFQKTNEKSEPDSDSESDSDSMSF
jgi:hypothetical protein